MSSHITRNDLSRELGQYLDRRVRQDKFSGTVMVAKTGEVIFQQAYGLASQRYNIPNRVDTKFNLGSMNKMFTGVAVVQLAQKGRLDYKDLVGQHLPDFPNTAVAEKVSIHHLLTHTGGLGSYFNREFMHSAKEQFRTIDDYLPLMVKDPLLFEPGERWSYSNSGFLLLGKIIETVSGLSYYDYIREHIYAPAGMLDTDCYEMDDDSIHNLAMGYTRMQAPPGKRVNNIFLHSFKGGPAGGGFSTAPDLLRFDQALRQHLLLDARSTETLWTGKVAVSPDPRSQYAYGFEDVNEYDTRVVGHGGGFPGINSKLDIYLDLGYTVAIMSNYDPMAAEGVASFIRKLITGTPQVQPVELDEAAIQPILGTFQAQGGPMPDLKVCIQQQGDALMLEYVPAMGMFEIIALSEDEFCDEETTDRRILLQRDRAGKVTGIEMRDRRDILQFQRVA